MNRTAPLLATALVAVACGGGQGAKAPEKTDEPLRPAAVVKKSQSGQGAVTAHVIASVGERTVGPFLARHADGRSALAAWVSPAEGQGRRVVALPLSGAGEPRGPERTLAFVPVDTTMLVVRTMRGPAPGFVVAWTSLTDRGESLHAVATGEDGTPRGKPIELARTNDDVVWVEVVATDLGAVLLWAEETRGGDANVIAASLDTDGKVRGVPARVAHAVTAWHALALPGGVGLSTVATAPKAKGGALSFQRLDLEGRAQGQPIVVAAKPTVSGDVEVVREASRVVFAWTDRTGDEPSIAAASLGDDDVVEAPRTILEARGGAALLGLASGAGGTALLSESPIRRGNADASRSVRIARIGAKLAPEKRAASFQSFGRATPELAPAGAGFAALLRARDCDLDPSCAPVASVLRFDGDLAVVQRERLDLSGDPAAVAWGLSCAADACFALAASGASPSRVRSIAVAARANAAAASRAPAPPKDAPRIADVADVFSGESVADMAAARIGDATIVATLSSKPDSKSTGLVLSTRTLEGQGAPVVISTRALAIGGVAVAAAERPEDGGAVAWVARENGDPEVHVTRIDKRGKRTSDVQLTTTKGEASDVAIAWAGGGWIVAWVDGRDGNGEVYATKVGLDLRRIAREERITNAPGDGSDLVALARGEQVWLAWADPRESPRDGMADIYVTALGARDAKKTLDDTRLLATAAHSRSPVLAPAEGGVQIAWIEEAPMGLESPGASGHGALWATLDGKAKIARGPVKLPLSGEGAATSVAIEPGRAVVARSGADGIALDGILLGTTPRSFALLALDGPPSLDVVLVLGHDSRLLFNDDGPTAADKRARRARIDWTP